MSWFGGGGFMSLFGGEGNSCPGLVERVIQLYDVQYILFSFK